MSASAWAIGGYFGLQLSLASAGYEDLFSRTQCLDWFLSLNWALSYCHGPTWPSLDLTCELASWFDLGPALSARLCLMVWTLGCYLWAHPAWLSWGCGVTSGPDLPSLGDKTCFCCSLFCFLQGCVWVHRGEVLCYHNGRRWWLLPTLQKC